MCPHASGVMPVGARGLFTPFIAPVMQSRPILGQQCCQVLPIWWCVWCTCCGSFHIVCTSAFVGPKNVPACVRGYASRRRGILLHILVYLCCNIVQLCFNNGAIFQDWRHFWNRLLPILLIFCDLGRIWYQSVIISTLSQSLCPHQGKFKTNVPACVRGYASRRPGIFLHILVYLCCNIFQLCFNHGAMFQLWGHVWHRLLSTL